MSCSVLLDGKYWVPLERIDKEAKRYLRVVDWRRPTGMYEAERYRGEETERYLQRVGWSWKIPARVDETDKFLWRVWWGWKIPIGLGATEGYLWVGWGWAIPLYKCTDLGHEKNNAKKTLPELIEGLPRLCLRGLVWSGITLNPLLSLECVLTGILKRCNLLCVYVKMWYTHT